MFCLEVENIELHPRAEANRALNRALNRVPDRHRNSLFRENGVFASNLEIKRLFIYGLGILEIRIAGQALPSTPTLTSASD